MTTSWRRGGELAVLLLLAVLVVGPLLLSGGYALVGDMTFVPRQSWTGAWLGLDGGVPRAVPADAVVSALTYVVPGAVVQRAVLLGTLLLAAVGARRAAEVLLPDVASSARLVAAVLYVWNPFVFERLAIGHWGLLVGYAALPWAASSAVRMRQGRPAAAAAVVVASGAAAVGSPTGGVLVSVVALVMAVGRENPRTVLLLAGALLAVNLPWLVPALVNDVGTSDPEGVSAFAARADTPFGLWGSLLGSGAIWKPAATPGDRHAVVLAGTMLLLVLVALAALARLRQWRLLAVGAAFLLVAGLPATGPGGAAARWLVEEVPGAGLLRDSQKWIMPLTLVGCLGLAVVVDALARRVRARWMVPVAAVAVPVVLLPSLAWGLAGRLDPVDYPDEWNTVRRILDEKPRAQLRTAVLPWSAYQRLPFNDHRAALDPSLRFFPGQVLTSEALEVGSVVVDADGEATQVPTISDGAALATALRGLGARFVVIERTAAGGSSVTVPDGRVLHRGRELWLIDLGGSAVLARSPHPRLIVAGDILAAVVLLGATGVAATQCVREHTNRRRVR